MTTQSPLEQYYRRFRKYYDLPSGNYNYPESVVVFNDAHELGIKAMTGADEMALHNPDALLNGEAINQIIKSCVPGVKDPLKLLNGDVNFLMAAIKSVSNGDKTDDQNFECPKCKHNNVRSIDYEYLLDNPLPLNNEGYIVHLDSGASIFIKPYTYSEYTKVIKKTMSNSRLFSKITSNTIVNEYDPEKLKLISKSIEEISKLNTELLIDSIYKIVDENNNLEIFNDHKNKNLFIDMLNNIDKSDFDKINDMVADANLFGIKKKTEITCDNIDCGHTWEDTVDTNPLDFFLL